ncbi:GAF and ANTAR domain-containing protein [Streptomyces sp. NPDC060194]|uniref:GAF and ANTAR domain-containing protein n=1 Tax=Streptomyces sp. NPDC060194 TaxID=3347069 RepID=UPI00364D9788
MIARVFAAAAEGDLDELPVRLCRAALDELPAQAASLALVPDSPARQLLAACGPGALRVEELQFETVEGPCVTAVRTGAPVVVPDLGHETTPWPLFGALVREQVPAVRAIHAFPLALEPGPPFGTLDLLFHRPTPPAPWLTDRGQAVASAISLVLLRAYGDLPDEDAPAPWERGPDSREHWMSSHLAAGILAQRLGIGTDEALARIRAQAFLSGEPLPRIAAQVIEEPVGDED